MNTAVFPISLEKAEWKNSASFPVALENAEWKNTASVPITWHCWLEKAEWKNSAPVPTTLEKTVIEECVIPCCIGERRVKEYCVSPHCIGESSDWTMSFPTALDEKWSECSIVSFVPTPLKRAEWMKQVSVSFSIMVTAVWQNAEWIAPSFILTALCRCSPLEED